MDVYGRCMVHAKHGVKRARNLVDIIARVSVQLKEEGITMRHWSGNRLECCFSVTSD